MRCRFFKILVTGRDIPAGTVLGEYVGTVWTDQESFRGSSDYYATYLEPLQDMVIDARRPGLLEQGAAGAGRVGTVGPAGAAGRQGGAAVAGAEGAAVAGPVGTLREAGAAAGAAGAAGGAAAAGTRGEATWCIVAKVNASSYVKPR